MNTQKVLCFVFIIYGCTESINARISDDELRTSLPNGSKLIGKSLLSHEGRIIKAFIGIPYAKPPVGDLRFKAPERIEPWDGEYQATYDRDFCVQKDPFRRSMNITGSEDCLHLNVYTPLNSNNSSLSVMVWFHGGAFVTGSGISQFYDPGYLLDHDIVFVSANYRLGSLGFLSSGQQDCPGNFGLKDQVLVLKWIQENIQVFGGNPESVTVFGQSAGGASVTYLMMSPLAKGLFSKAIAQSGNSLSVCLQPPPQKVVSKRAIKLAEVLNCYLPDDWANTMKCLRKVPAEKIIAVLYDFFNEGVMVAFPPVVEPDLPGAFLTKHPREIDHVEESFSIPLLTGVTYDEGLLKSAKLINSIELFEDFFENLNSALPRSLCYDHQNKITKEYITSRIIDFYFKNRDPSTEKFKNTTNLFTDSWFLEGMNLHLQKRFSHPNVAPTYVYLYTHRGAISFSQWYGCDQGKFYGVSHSDEILQLFPISKRFQINVLPSESDKKVRKAITELWVNFARTGNPTPDSSDLPKWVEANKFPQNYYRIGNLNFDDKPLLGMEENGIFGDRAAFWREVGVYLSAPSKVKEEL